MQENGGFYVLQGIRTETEQDIINAVASYFWTEVLSGHPLSFLFNLVFNSAGLEIGAPQNLLQFAVITNQGIGPGNEEEEFLGAPRIADRMNIVIVDFYNGWNRWAGDNKAYPYYVDFIKDINLARYGN